VPGQVLHRVLPFAILVLGWLLQHSHPAGAGTLELGVDVVNAHLDDVRRRVRLRRLLFPSDVSDDHRAIDPDLHLRPVCLTYADALDEAEDIGEPGHCGANVRIHQHRDDRRGWDRAIADHSGNLRQRRGRGQRPIGRLVCRSARGT
jgi:hypothetical protein